MKNKEWQPEEKMAIVLAMLKGDKTVSQIIKENGVADSIVYRWRDEALEAIMNNFSDKGKGRRRTAAADREQLLKIIGEQAVALEFQKKILIRN